MILLSFDINDTLVDLLIVLIIHLILPIINNIHYKTTLPETGCYLSYLIIYSYQTSRYHIDFYNIILIFMLTKKEQAIIRISIFCLLATAAMHVTCTHLSQQSPLLTSSTENLEHRKQGEAMPTTINCPLPRTSSSQPSPCWHTVS